MSGILTKLGLRGKAGGTDFTPRANIPRSDVQGAVEYIMDNAENVGTPYAPTDAQYLTSASAAGLSNERVVGDGTGIAWDFTGLGTAVANWSWLGIEALTDPGADRGMFWDDSEGAFKFFTPAGGLAFVGEYLSITDPDLAAIVQEASFAAGDILFHNGTTLARLPAGSYADYLRISAGGIPEWASFPAGSGLGDLLSTNNLAELTDAAQARINLGLAIGTNVQAYDAQLDEWSTVDPSENGKSLVTAADYSAMRTLLSLVPGTNVQAYDATLASISALGTAADKLAYTTGVDTWAETGLTAFARSILDDADEATFKATVNLEIGTDIQAYSANLDSWAAVNESSYYNATETDTAISTAVNAAIDAVGSIVVLRGDWDASAGTFPGGGSAQAGWSYIVSTGGTVNGVTFVANDRIVAITDNASTTTYAANWFKLDYTDAVLSVAGKTGAVTIQVADITDMSANGRSLTSAANYAAMRTLLDLEAGTDFYSKAAADAAFQPLDELLTEIAALSTDPNADSGIFFDDSAGAMAYWTPASGVEFSGTNLRMTANQRTRTLTFIIDGGGSTITTGIKGDLEIPFACTITAVTALADQSGSIVVDIWNDTRANFPPTDADTITAAAPVTITTATNSQDTTLTGWDTAIAAGDILRFNVDSVTTIQRLTISIKVTMT